MQHFSSHQWADFVRNVSGDKEKAAMQAHLETGCKRCSKALGAWARVREIVTRERSYQPPESVVRTVKAALAAIHGRPARIRVAQLLFDSLLAPALAGVRSGASAPRQMLFGIGDYRIDVRIEPSADTMTLTGQMLVSTDPARPVRDVEVKLTKGRETLAISRTNEFGEFELNSSLTGDLHLEFAIPQGMPIRIPVLQTPGTDSGGESKSTDTKGLRHRKRRKSRRTRK